jgi:chromate transporter
MILLRLAGLFASLSLLAFGGGSGVLPDIQRATVERYHWLDASTFIDLFAISRAAPGPNSIIVLLIGLKAAGLVGALVAALAMFLPSLLLVHLAARYWRRLERAPWRRHAETTLAPVAVGLIFAAGISLVRGTESGVLLWAITAVATLVLVATRLHPALVLAAGGLVTVLADQLR